MMKSDKINEENKNTGVFIPLNSKELEDLRGIARMKGLGVDKLLIIEVRNLIAYFKEQLHDIGLRFLQS